MKKSYFLIICFIVLIGGILKALPIVVGFREYVTQGDSTTTLKLVLNEDPGYPVGFDNNSTDQMWLIQVYKDGGDGIISPLDVNGLPTGDDVTATDTLMFNPKQRLKLRVPYAFNLQPLRFFAHGEKGQVQQGDKIYVRIFNNSSLDKANKYIVAHTLYSIPYDNIRTEYVPDYAWDKQGWITFRK